MSAALVAHVGIELCTGNITPPADPRFPRAVGSRARPAVEVSGVHAAPIILERSEAGESQGQIAANYGISRQHVSKIVKQESKNDEKRARLNKAEAIPGYAKRAGLGLESQNLGAEVRLRAERRGGELLRSNPGFGRGRKSTTSVDLGITWHDSSRWQAIAGIPEDDFERHVADIKPAKREAKKGKALGENGVIVGDFREADGVVQDESVDLIFTDPPYDKQAVVLYSGLAEFASRVLRPCA